MKIMRKSAVGIIGIAVFIAALCCVALAADLSDDAEPAAVDAAQYADFMSEEVLDLQDLAQWAEIQRRFFNRITPADVSLFQPMSPPVVPFDAANFKGSFLDDLLGEDQNSVAIYPLTLALDLETRETLVYNADGKLIAAVSQNNAFPAVSEGEDPSRVMLQLDLLPTEDVEPYLYVERRVAESLAAAEESTEPGGAAMMSLEEGEFGFVEFQSQTNGTMLLTVTNSAGTAEVFSYTVWHTADVVVVTYTNEQSNVVTDTNTLWYPVSPPYNGMESAWTNRTTNLTCTNGVGVWEDANVVSNARVRFYAVTLRTDTDGDGLTDGAEYFVHHTNPGTNDTDGDGIWDGWEILYGLNTSSNDALLDPDGDGRVNIEEFNYSNSTYYTACIFGDSNPTNKDTDGDGVTDGPLGGGGAYTNGPDAFPRDPCAVADTDCDGQPDALVCTNTTLSADADDDNDGIADTNEASALDQIIPITIAPVKAVNVQARPTNQYASAYSAMAVVGDTNLFTLSWTPTTRNMTLISNYLWEVVLTFNNRANGKFKFAANGGWTTAWGDSSQSNTNPPIVDTANTGSVPDIALGGSLHGTYRFRLNEQTYAYSVEKLTLAQMGSESFDVSSSGRLLPYAQGSNASNGFGNVNGGIYFNHDYTNLYIGIAGLDVGENSVFMLFLDTDGTNGGARTLSTLSGAPKAFGNADNIAFSATNFTPNMGILVGCKTYWGRNYPYAYVGANEMGQGVYRLTTNTMSDFPGFSTNGGGRISQWGDRVGDHAPANAGVEIAIAFTNLAISPGSVIKVAGIFAGGESGTNRYLSGEAYGASISGTFDNTNYGGNAITLIGAPVYISAMNASATGGFSAISSSDVVLQGFYWDVPFTPDDGTWYSNLTAMANASNSFQKFSMIWLPPPSKGNSDSSYPMPQHNNSMGYDPYDHYDLGTYDSKFSTETPYGSEAELIQCVQCLAATGMVPMVDLVLNHMAGGYGGGGSGRYNYDYPHNIFEKQDAAGNNSSNYFNTAGSCEPFHVDKGYGSNSGDVNHEHPYMRNGLKNWGTWLSAKVGYRAYRFDVAYHIDPWFISEFMNYGPMKGKFAVMEGWSLESGQTTKEMETYLALTDNRAAMFDMPLREKLAFMCNDPANFNMEWLNDNFLSKIRPESAVTFVESHDTVHTGGGDEKWGIREKKELAYAFTLISDGIPCVFYHDYYEPPYADQYSTNGWSGVALKSRIDPLIDVRKAYAAGETTYLSVSNKQYLYIARRAGAGTKPGCILSINNHTNTPMFNTLAVGSFYTNGTVLVDYLDNSHSVTVTVGQVTLGASNRSYRVYVKQ